MANFDNSDTPMIRSLKQDYENTMKRIQAGSMTNDEADMLFGRIRWICNEIQCLTHQELRSKICPCCDKKYDGHGNDAWPLPYDRVCDECNANEVIPARFTQMRDDE